MDDRSRPHGGLSPRLVTDVGSDIKPSRALPSPVFQWRGESLVPSPAEHLRDLAGECRRLAATTRDENICRDLILTAERFERLARLREQQEKTPARSN